MYRFQYQGLTDGEFARLIAYDLATDQILSPEKVSALIALLAHVSDTFVDEPVEKDPAQMELPLN